MSTNVTEDTVKANRTEDNNPLNDRNRYTNIDSTAQEENRLDDSRSFKEPLFQPNIHNKSLNIISEPVLNKRVSHHVSYFPWYLQSYFINYKLTK